MGHLDLQSALLAGKQYLRKAIPENPEGWLDFTAEIPGNVDESQLISFPLGEVCSLFFHFPKNSYPLDFHSVQERWLPKAYFDFQARTLHVCTDA